MGYGSMKNKKKKKNSKTKRIWGIILLTGFIGIFLLSQMIVITRLFLFEKNVVFDWIMYLLFMIILLLPTLGLTIAAILRIKEIQKGEVEKSKKY